jgi:hypothetical protein
MLAKTHLIPRMVEHYKTDKSTGARGYIVLILNVLRLTAETQDANDYIAQLLYSSQEWRSLWPTIKDETVRQVCWRSSFPESYKARPTPHVAPNSIQLLSALSTEAGAPRRPIDVDADEGVHLGSTCKFAIILA